MQTPTPEWLCQRIVEDAPEAIIFSDRDGTIRLWNAGAEAVFGYRAAEAVGRSLDLIIPEKQRARHWEGYRRVMATGVTRYGRGELLKVPAVRKDGRRISLEFSILLPRNAAGEVLGAAAILRDVTERWERDRALRRRLAALEGGGQGPQSRPAEPPAGASPFPRAAQERTDVVQRVSDAGH